MMRILRSRRLWLALIAIAILASFPSYMGFYYLGVLTIAYYFAVYAMSWDLLFGYSGEVNFGPTFLIGLGAYGAALTNTSTAAPLWLCVVVGTVAAVIGGLLLAAPALRLRGPYFGLVTLVAVLILDKLITIFAGVTGGEIGLALPSVLTISAAGNYYYALGFMVISAAVLLLIANSSIGLILEASGQDPVETEALGFSVTKFKYLAFVVSSLFSGIAGALTVFYLGTASTGTVVALSVAVQVIIATVLGGRRSIVGSIIGAVFLIIAAEVLRPLGQLSTVVVAGMALLVLLFYPDGFIGLFTRTREASR